MPNDLVSREAVMAAISSIICRPITPAMLNEAIANLPSVKGDERFKFAIGDDVSKCGGDYRFDGKVVMRGTKLSGVDRYVVEDDRGILHIYGPANLSLSPPPQEANPHE